MNRRPHAFTLRGSPAPVQVGKIVGVGRNYAAHAQEMGHPPGDDRLVLFLKPPTALRPGPGPLAIPRDLGSVHHEVELVVAVGGVLSRAGEAEARSSILGYGVGLDLTLRDLQTEAKRRGEPWAVAKGFDHSAPVSIFVPASEAGEILSAEIRLSINDSLRQSAPLAGMIRPPARLLSEISRLFTLEPGDLVFTGTPAGVGPVVPGDRLRAEITGFVGLEISIV